MARRLAVLACALGLLAACGMVAGIDGLEIGDCKGGAPCAQEGGGGSDGPVEGSLGDTSTPDEGGELVEGGLPCPAGTKGPVMVRVGRTTNNFCIDTTEVTVGQYREFTEAKAGDAGGQPKECAWNLSYAAGAGGLDDNLPISAIDWCDARAYCEFAGKRLCGKHQSGKFVGSVLNSELGDFETHEWLLACSNVGERAFPYGGLRQPMACNFAETDAGGRVAVKSMAGCTGGFSGIHDMLGNVWEWFDSPCLPPDAGGDAAGIDAGPQKDECVVKGGSFAVPVGMVSCGTDGRPATRDRRATDVGFRCCAD